MEQENQQTPTSSSSETIESSSSSENSETNSDIQIENKTNSPEKQKEILKKLNKLSIKVDGNEEDIELPFEIEDKPEIVEWMKKNLQMSKMAGKRAQEKATFERQVTSFIEELKKNPKKALANPAIGIDVKKFAQEIIEDEIQQMQKTPEQIEKEKLTAELEELRAEREREKEEFRQKELQSIQQQEHQRYDTLFTQALASAELPKTDYTVKKMADTMLAALEHGIQVEPQDIVGIVKEEILKDIESMFSVMPSEVVSKVVGKKHLDSIRKTNVAKAKEKIEVDSKKQVTDVSKTKVEPKTETKKMTYKDFFKI